MESLQPTNLVLEEAHLEHLAKLVRTWPQSKNKWRRRSNYCWKKLKSIMKSKLTLEEGKWSIK
jgi:hypothetical protein